MIAKLLRLFGLTRLSDVHERLFNVPIKVARGQMLSVNERVLEIPIIHRYLSDIPIGARVLDFGCTRSWVSVTLASMGYKVIGSDLRNFDFKHPNFQFECKDIREAAIEPVDCVVAVSTLEHVGLGAYDEDADDSAIGGVLETLNTLLKTDGALLLTVPVGHPEQDDFQRIFDPEQLKSLLANHGFRVAEEVFYHRDDELTWLPGKDFGARNRDFLSGVGSMAFFKCLKT